MASVKSKGESRCPTEESGVWNHRHCFCSLITYSKQFYSSWICPQIVSKHFVLECFYPVPSWYKGLLYNRKKWLKHQGISKVFNIGTWMLKTTKARFWEEMGFNKAKSSWLWRVVYPPFCPSFMYSKAEDIFSKKLSPFHFFLMTVLVTFNCFRIKSKFLKIFYRVLHYPAHTSLALTFTMVPTCTQLFYSCCTHTFTPSGVTFFSTTVPLHIFFPLPELLKTFSKYTQNLSL